MAEQNKEVQHAYVIYWEGGENPEVAYTSIQQAKDIVLEEYIKELRGKDRLSWTPENIADDLTTLMKDRYIDDFAFIAELTVI